MHKTLDLKDTLPLPYNLIEAASGGFELDYIGLKEGQNEYSLKYGVEGKFLLRIYGLGTEIISEVCDLTVGNVYEFFRELKIMMKDIKGTAVLKEYGERTINISFTAEKRGIVSVRGVYCPKDTGIIDEIKFCFEVEPNVLDNSLKRFKTLFDSLAEIQGYYEFNI